MLLPIAWPGRTALGLFVMMEVGQYLVQVTKFKTGKPRTDWFRTVLISQLHTVVLWLICRHRDIGNSTYMKVILK